MNTLQQPAWRIRLLVLGLAGVLGTLASVTFYRWGTSATDENLFVDTPSPVYALSRLAPPGGTDPPAGEAAAIEPGDLVFAIGDAKVESLAGFDRARQSAVAGTTPVRVVAVRRHGPGPKGVVKVAVTVEPAALRDFQVREVANTVLVVEVIRGGASDRAGMRVGDLIVRINGQRFENAATADLVMRRSQIGRAIAYDVLRAGEPLTLHVTMAAFGVQFAPLTVVLPGLVFFLYGGALALLRPRIKGALYLGLSFLVIGYVLIVVVIRRDFIVTPFVAVRNFALVACAYFGLALGCHAEHYFPRERTEMIGRRWGRWLPYAVAAAATLGVMAATSAMMRDHVRSPNAIFAAGLVVMLFVTQYVTWRGRGERTPEDRAMMRPLRYAKLSLPVIAAALLSGAAILGKVRESLYYAFALLVFVPAAYTYVIAKYRLLDLDLRVRRSVQYSIASITWGALSIVALLWVLSYLPSLRLSVPNIQVSSSSVEVLDQPATEAHRLWLEKGLLMIAAIGLAFLFRAVGRGGQHWIASRFHRTAYDYKRASTELAAVMGTRLDLDGLADGLVGTLVRLMPLKQAGVIFVHGSRRYCGSRAPGFASDAWAGLCSRAADQIVGLAARAASEITVNYLAEPLRGALRAAGVQYLFPIHAHDSLVGVVLVGEKRSESAFVDDDFQFLGAVSRQVSAGVENAFLYEDLAEQERLRHELDIARRIQLESLPQFTPVVEGLDVAGASLPAFEVGGDYFDYLNGDPQQLTVMVGDVSGKGTSAALYMSKLQGIVRSLHGFRLTPREMFVRTNDLLGRDLERRAFVTALGAFFNSADRRLVLARAGHLPLYHWDARAREVRRVLPRGLGFGLSNHPVFDEELEEKEIRYAPGDLFLLITDGITECLATQGEDFGEGRVMALLRESALAGHTAAAVRDRLLGAVRQFAGDAEQFDDQTVVVVRAVA